MNEHARFLREESEAAMSDGCPVASNGYKRAAEEIESLLTENSELKAERKVLWEIRDDLMKQRVALTDEIRQKDEFIDSLECDAEWCGKSPRGTPGKRGYDDGKCQICKIKSATTRQDKS